MWFSSSIRSTGRQPYAATALVVLVAWLALIGCSGDDAATPDGLAEPDGATEPDAEPDEGVEPDAEPDEGVEPDAEPDEGVEPDAEPDEGVEPDAEPDDDVAASQEIEIFFTNPDLGGETEVFPVERRVDGPRVLTGALGELLAGPTADERAQGYSSWFSQETEGMLRSVAIEEGVARVSFDAGLPTAIPNASTSAGSATLLAALDATAEQFPTVERAVYSLDGDVDAFYEWLQLAPPE